MKKTISVIDGNSLMHRAYHAIQTPMTSPDGTPTNAVFGFLQMLCKFIETAGPEAIVCAFDEGKPEHRIQEMPEYKAQRPHMDDELRVQFPIVEELLAAMNVPIVKVPGWEGDDILGTIAKRDEDLGYETLLVTGDKDACQLATDLTKIVTTKKGISEVAIFGPDEVMEKYGVTPDQFTDYLGLMGDSSDNIPGVAGIGPKSATKLLQQYGTIEGVYEHIDELKGKQKQNLLENEDLAYLSRQIATIVTDLDFPLDLEEISFPDFEAADVEEAFKKYALSSPLSRVLNLIGEERTTAPTIEISTGRELGVGEFEEALTDGRTVAVGFAFERSDQDGLFASQIEACFAIDEGHIILDGEDAMQMLLNVVSRKRIIVDDLKTVLGLLYPPDTAEVAAIEVDQLYSIDAFDLGLAAYDLDSGSSDYSVSALAMKYLGGEISEEDDRKMRLAKEAHAIFGLEPILKRKLEEDGSSEVYEMIDLPLVPVLVQMERIGVEIDCEHLSELGYITNEELNELSTSIYAIAGTEFNIDSPKQLSHVLFEEMGLTPIKKNQRGYSTDAKVMTELAKTEEIASLVLKYRELSKIKSTYIDNLPKMRGGDRRLHTVFHETVTTTGRLSSSDPNLQNIPVRTEYGKQIRECFIPLDEDSVFMSADYSQIELRLLAHLSGDQGLIDAFNSGADFHAQTAAGVFGVDVSEVTPNLRSKAKAVNFGIVYGQQAYGLSQALDIDFNEAKEMIDRYYTAYPDVRTYLDDIVDSAAKSGYAETIFGRKRRIPELKSSNKQVKGVGQRTAMNHPMQGSAADIIKLAMIRVERAINERGSASSLLLQVHDELDLSVPRSEIHEMEILVKEIMENIVELKVPLLVDVSWGQNWAEAH